MSILSTYDIYKKGCIALARSIVIKHTLTAETMNTYDTQQEYIHSLKGKYTPMIREVDPKTWRYTYHLSGRYHPLDLIELGGSPIQVKSTDTLEMIDFTLETLRDHKGTLREYRKKEEYYNTLISKHPDKITLIDGILNPIPVERILNARENEILWYDSSLVEVNEYSLMDDVQTQIDIFFKRINNDQYKLTDDLYIPAKLGILYMYLPGIIMDVRYRYARSIEAHSFHVWSWLGSHQWLDEYKAHLSLYQRMWFYRNMRWVEANAGKTKTFTTLTDVVMTHRGLPLAGFDYENVVDEMEANNSVMYPTSRFRRVPLNLLDSIRQEGKYKDPDQMVNDQIPVARDNTYWLEVDQRVSEQKLSRSSVKNLPTKVLESRVNDISKRNVILKDDVALNTWLYMTYAGLYRARITVLNPKNSELINLDQRDAIILFLFLLHRSFDLPITKIPTVIARRVFTVNRPDINTMLGWIDERYTDRERVLAIDHYCPEVKAIISTEAFAEYIEKVYEARMIHRNIYSFTHEAHEHDQLKTLVANVQQDVLCKYTEGEVDYETWLKDKGWDLLDIGVDEATIMRGDILTKAVGGDLFVRQSLNDIQGMMIRLLKKLSSYSVQFIRKINADQCTVLDWGYLRTDKGELNLRLKNIIQTHLSGLDVFNQRNKLFHKGKAVLKKLVRYDNIDSRLWSDAKIDMVLDLDHDHRMMTRTRFRQPTIFVDNVSVCIKAPNPETAFENPWDLDQFRIHKSTEDRSIVKVDESGQLIIRGVVYIKDGETGAKKIQLTDKNGNVEVIDYDEETLLEIAACKTMANWYPICPVKPKVESSTHDIVTFDNEDLDHDADIVDRNNVKPTHTVETPTISPYRFNEQGWVRYTEYRTVVEGRNIVMDVIQLNLVDTDKQFTLPCKVVFKAGYLSVGNEDSHQLDHVLFTKTVTLTKGNTLMTRVDDGITLLYNNERQPFDNYPLVKDVSYNDNQSPTLSLYHETRDVFKPLKSNEYNTAVFMVELSNGQSATALTQENGV